MSLRRGLPIAVLVAIIFSLLASTVAEALDRATTQRVIKSVVQFIAVDEGRRGMLIPKWTGSGTIISPDGLILTNCHVAYPEAMYGADSGFDYDLLAVALTVASDQAPQPSYIAEVVQYSADLDLAVVRLTKSIDGTPVDPATLNLPYLPLGDSDFLEIGDNVSILGYPGIGGETITFTSGNVSGFSSARGVEGRAWIKTDATVAGGNSGGTAVDDEGLLVGVPTKFGAGDDLELDCRQYSDTNNDGRIDENDACIPMGGFINALRPVKLALPLIEAAQHGLQTQPAPEVVPGPSSVAGVPTISRPLFAPAVNDFDQPVSVMQSFPSGTETIYLLFDYDGLEDGASWQPVLVYDGEVYDDIWAPASWNGGARGTSWLSIQNDPLADGAYEFVINYQGQEIGSASVTVGGGLPAGPQISDIRFASGNQTGYVFAAGSAEVEASFEYEGLARNQDWSFAWYYEREEIGRGAGTRLPGGSGTGSLFLSPPQGLQVGVYRLELFLDDVLAATSDLYVGGQGAAAEVFGPVTFAEGVDRRGNPQNPGTSFEHGIGELYAFFDYTGMRDGWDWTREWALDGEAITSVDDTWSYGESGEAFWIAINSDEALPVGDYQLSLTVLGEVVREGTCSIAGSPEPTPTPLSPADGLEVYGYVLDATTGRGIRSAFFIVLQPGVTVDQFEWEEDQVYAWGETDRRGYYELPLPLFRGETYSMIAGAEGYYGIAEDGILIGDDLESPFELSLTLQRIR